MDKKYLFQNNSVQSDAMYYLLYLDAVYGVSSIRELLFCQGLKTTLKNHIHHLIFSIEITRVEILKFWFRHK